MNQSQVGRRLYQPNGWAAAATALSHIQEDSFMLLKGRVIYPSIVAKPDWGRGWFMFTAALLLDYCQRDRGCIQPGTLFPSFDQSPMRARESLRGSTLRPVPEKRMKRKIVFFVICFKPVAGWWLLLALCSLHTSTRPR